jgi:hypothetical protein
MARLFKPGGTSDTTDVKRDQTYSRTDKRSSKPASRSANPKRDLMSVRSVRGQKVPSVLPLPTPLPMPATTRQQQPFDPRSVMPPEDPAMMQNFLGALSLPGRMAGGAAQDLFSDGGFLNRGGIDPGTDALLRAIMARMGGQ